jgi:site-specific DNA recombinase
MKPNPHDALLSQAVRCAIYTRKSSTEGLEQAFSSLDAQREAALAYIASQQPAGWLALPHRYDDGGCTGSNLDRPALQQLLEDIRAGRMDCVLVYKVDRLSRSLLDFARLMEVFATHHVAFVSVTQQFNTATSLGRLVLHLLLSFAQFERELIAERTRDKLAAARRKGQWVGGRPLLGFDVDPHGGKLVVNPEEAARVRAIFALYLQYQALRPLVRELARRGWHSKRWRTRQGHERGGQPFTPNSLRRLLRNVTYRGQIRYQEEVHAGEHAALVDEPTWQHVQTLLHEHRPSQGGRRAPGALLQGLLRCASCGCAMTSSQSTKGSRCYRYYLCRQAHQQGWHTCPAPAVPAGPLEALVLAQLGDAAGGSAAGAVDAADGSAWPLAEQARALQRRVEQIDYDGVRGLVSIRLRASGRVVGAEAAARPYPEQTA